MAVLNGTYGLVAYQSLSFQVTMTAASDTVDNADLVTDSGFAVLVPKGPLNTFLTVGQVSAAVAETAFRAIGGCIEVRQIAGATATEPNVAWSAAGPSVPFLTISNGAAGVILEIRIRVPHSIVQ